MAKREADHPLLANTFATSCGHTYSKKVIFTFFFIFFLLLGVHVGQRMWQNIFQYERLLKGKIKGKKCKGKDSTMPKS